MKSAVGLGIAFIVLAAEISFVTTLILAPDLSPVGQSALDEYVRYQRAQFTTDLTVTRVVHATRPWLFTAAASSATFGDSLFYRTARSYQVVTITVTLEAGPGGGVVSRQFSVRPSTGERAVPYPPKEVWCAVLKDGAGQSKVVFAALHFDLHNADWIVHESSAAPGSTEINRTLSEIGCDPGPEP